MAPDGAWKCWCQRWYFTEYVTTSDVQTTIDEPAKPTGFTGLDSTQDLGYLTNQKLVNWYFAEEFLTNKEDLQKIIWIGEDPPEDDTYLFWWHSLNLELLTKYNGQWFPVAIPPAQVETLRQEIDAIYEVLVIPVETLSLTKMTSMKLLL